MRWIYHLLARDTRIAGDYTPASLAAEGFVHGSFLDAVADSARLYFAPAQELDVLQIDPRRLPSVPVLATTPRGVMPHLYGAIPADAIRARVASAAIGTLPDHVTGTRVAIVAFDGMTLLDLVAVFDPLSRIASMGFDPTTTVEIVGAHRGTAWHGHGATLAVERVRPDLARFDLVVVPGGHGTRALVSDLEVLEWLGSYPPHRLIASVCTGALVLGALGRLHARRATTHASALGDLARYGATAVDARVVDEGSVITAGGVTAGIDLGLHLVARLLDATAADRIATQMAWPPARAATSGT